MAPLEFEISTSKGISVGRVVVEEESGRYPIGDSGFVIHRIIPGKRNSQPTIKRVEISVDPPYSDRRKQTFSFNGKPSNVVEPEAGNTLAGGNYVAKARLTNRSPDKT